MSHAMNLGTRFRSLPLSPFHYPLAYLLNKLHWRLSLPGLIVGSIFPDVEIPIIFLLFGGRLPLNRLVLHSLLGGAIFGTFLAAAFTTFFYPSLMGFLDPGLKWKARERCRFSRNLIVSCLLGVLSHVLLDYTNHPFNPILWPSLGTLDTPSVVYFALERIWNASTMIHIFMGTLLIGLIIKNRGKEIFTKLFVGGSQ